MIGPLQIKQGSEKEVSGQRFMNIHLTLPQEKLTAFYLGQVPQESRGLRMHIRRYWLSLLLMKLLKHNLNSGITKTEKEDLKRRSATAT